MESKGDPPPWLPPNPEPINLNPEPINLNPEPIIFHNIS